MVAVPVVMMLAVMSAGPQPALARRKQAAVVAPVRLIPDRSDPLAVQGLDPYFGQVVLDSASDGLVVTNRLGLEEYLLGLNEVPTDWPMEALKAQAVAARTYALWTLSQPPGGSAAIYGFDICASIECQVFSGATVATSSDGRRWVEAVRSTAGEAVLYDGEPILARYSSTTGGKTLDNSQAFPDEDDYPYLVSVPSKTEKAAPLYRWRTSFALEDLQAILERAGWWASAGRLREVRSVPSRTGLHYPDLVFRGTRGRLRRTAEEAREVIRDLAPAMFPSKYPSLALTSTGRLPETWPSNRIKVRTEKRVVRVVGRGWGHGVGMSQWGAHGMAARGDGYEDILGHYYTDTEVGEVASPGPLDVGVAWGRSEVTVTGSFAVLDGRRRTLVGDALGDWTFRFAGPGAVSLDTPKGYGLPLRVGIVRAPKSVIAGRRAKVTIALSKPAIVQAEHEPGGGSSGAVKTAGRSRIGWRAPDEPGSYEVRVAAAAGDRTTRSESVTIVVAEPDRGPVSPERPEAARDVADDGGFPWLLALGVIFGAAGAVVLGSRILGWRRPSWRSR
jgi:stage II sporulation protein D